MADTTNNTDNPLPELHLKLEGFTDEQRHKFVQAFNYMPAYAQTILNSPDVSFKLSPHPVPTEAAIASDGVITITEETFIRPSVIFAYGLVQKLNVSVPQDVLNNATEQHTQRLKFTIRADARAALLTSEHFKNLPHKDLKATILATMYADIVSGTRQTAAPSKRDARYTLYDQYVTAAKKFADSKQAATSTPLPIEGIRTPGVVINIDEAAIRAAAGANSNNEPSVPSVSGDISSTENTQYPTCQIVTPDCIALHLDMQPEAVADSLVSKKSSHPLDDTFLVTFKPSDLEDAERVKAKIEQTLHAVQRGEFDHVFTRIKKIPATANPPTVEEYKTRITDKMNEYLQSREKLVELITDAKEMSSKVRRLHGTQPSDQMIEEFTELLRKNPKLFPHNVDKVFKAEAVPILLTSENRNFKNAKSRIFAVTDSSVLSSDLHKKASQLSTFKRGVFSCLQQIPGIELDDAHLHALVPDYQKVHYAINRKREAVRAFNKKHPEAERLPFSLPRDKVLAMDKLDQYYNSNQVLAEIDFVLSHYPPEDKRVVLLNEKFDHALAFHAAGIEYLNQRITALYPDQIPTQQQAAAGAPPPPPPPPASPPPVEPDDNPENREPRTQEQLMARANRFVDRELPHYYQLRADLVNTPEHPIILRLSNAQGETHETTITTFQPNLDLARELKQQVVRHLMTIPGIAAYRAPLRGGHLNLQLDEFIPASVPNTRLKSKYGSYHFHLRWPALNEEMGISLGISHTNANMAEAQNRFDHANDYLSALRALSPSATHLPITKGELIEHMREWVAGRGQPWEEIQRQVIEHMPAALKLNFSGPHNNQDCWLHIDPMTLDGEVDSTWVQPLRFVVNGKQLVGDHRQLVGSGHINLRVRDKDVAQRRAIETINELLTHLQQFSQPGGGFALEANGRHVSSLTINEREASPQLLDSNRLRDIYNELRSPLNQDLAVRQVGQPTESKGQLLFTLGVFRGGCDGLAEPVSERNGNGTTPIIRSVLVPAALAGDFPKFVEAVNTTFTNDIWDKYEPRLPVPPGATHQQVIQPIKEFQPATIPLVLNDAMRTHLPNFPSFVPDPPLPPARGLRGGAAGTLPNR